MNNLNSVLLEGTLQGEVESAETKPVGEFTVRFTIKSVRFFKADNEYKKESHLFKILTKGKIAKSCAEHLTDGKGVRVVGRLTTERMFNGEHVVIIAEHVEFKPVFKNKKCE